MPYISVTGIVSDHVLVKTDDLHAYMSECVTSVSLQVSRRTGCAAAERGDERENRNHLSDGFLFLTHLCTEDANGSTTVHKSRQHGPGLEGNRYFICYYYFFKFKAVDRPVSALRTGTARLWSISHARTSVDSAAVSFPKDDLFFHSIDFTFLTFHFGRVTPSSDIAVIIRRGFVGTVISLYLL